MKPLPVGSGLHADQPVKGSRTQTRFLRQNSRRFDAHVFSSSLLSSNNQACGLVTSAIEGKSAFHQLPPKSVGNSRLFVLQPDSFLVFIRFILCEAMSYFSPARWVINIVSVVRQCFRFIFAIHSNIWEFGLDVKRKRAIARYLSSHSSHHASCAHEMA